MIKYRPVEIDSFPYTCCFLVENIVATAFSQTRSRTTARIPQYVGQLLIYLSSFNHSAGQTSQESVVFPEPD